MAPLPGAVLAELELKPLVSFDKVGLLSELEDPGVLVEAVELLVSVELNPPEELVEGLGEEEDDVEESVLP